MKSRLQSCLLRILVEMDIFQKRFWMNIHGKGYQTRHARQQLSRQLNFSSIWSSSTKMATSQKDAANRSNHSSRGSQMNYKMKKGCTDNPVAKFEILMVTFYFPALHMGDMVAIANKFRSCDNNRTKNSSIIRCNVIVKPGFRIFE